MSVTMKKPHNKKSSPVTVAGIAKILNCPYEGEGDTLLTGVSSLEQAMPGDLVFLAHPKYRKALETTKASAVILDQEEKFDRIPVIRSENPYLTFIKAVSFFYTPYCPEPGIHPQACISSSSKIGSHVSIGACAVIGDHVEIGNNTIIFPLAVLYPKVKVGRDCIIHSHVSIREGTLIGNKVIIHNNAVLGSDGFGYLPKKDGTREKIPQKGRVVIEDEVEIGANTAIDRAALGETIIRKGTKIDNLVQIAHNIEIGSNTILAAQTGIAGSTKIGKNVIAGGQVGISDHLEIGDNVILAAKSGVTKSIPANTTVSGSPHLEITEWRKAWVSIPRLYELIKEIRKLKKRLDKLEK